MELVAKAAPRRRAPVKSGYRKTTITIPASTHKKFQAFLKKNPGLSMSAFLTTAGEAQIREGDIDATV